MADLPNTTSAWSWQPTHSLYYNSVTQIWAAPQPDGTWHYSDPVPSTSQATLDTPIEAAADPRPAPEAYEDVEEGELPHEEWVQAGPRARSVEAEEVVPVLRLVVNKSEVLPPEQKVIVVDAAQPLTIGRDRAFGRRVRLKELAVSKTHASLFWTTQNDRNLEDEGGWGVTDHGSTQGTWLRRDGKEVRLSEAKVAGLPFHLRHDDTLRIGTTTFTVHIHPSLACATCALAPDSSNLVPLAEPTPTATPSVGLRTHTPTREERSTAVRTKMRDLKQQILKPAAQSKPAGGAASAASASAVGKGQFVDRAAARRARNGPEAMGMTSAAAGPGKAAGAVGHTPAVSPFFTVPGAKAGSTAAAATTNASATPPADPFAATSRGAKLLSKLSGPAAAPASSQPDATHTPGLSEGTAALAYEGGGGGLGKLVEARSFGQVGREERPGLGSRPMGVVGAQQGVVTAGGAGGGGEKRGWRDDVREMNRKRFREMGGE